VFTTHTPVPAGNEAFDKGLVKRYLDFLVREIGCEPEQLLSLGADDGNFNMTVLAIRLSSSTNGVSKLHAEVSSAMWRHLWPGEPKEPVGSVTNGVHTPSWVGPEMRALYASALGRDWEAHLLDPEPWKKIHDAANLTDDWIRDNWRGSPFAFVVVCAGAVFGFWNFYGSEVQKDLAITKDQQEKLAGLYTDVREQKLKVFAADGKANRETDSILQQLKDIDAKRDQRGTEILTKEQQQKFAELKGKRFDLSTLPPQYAGRGPRMPFGFRRGGLMELALMEPVMKELRIDKDAPQVPELRKLADTYFAEHGKEFQRMRHDQIEVEIANPFRIAPAVQAKIDPELKKLLTLEQFTRLRQINWQNEGVAALYDPAIEEALEITSDQQKQLSDLNYENQRKHTRLLNPRDGEPRLSAEEIQKKGAELNAERDRRINDILTKTQQEKFTELKGKPFDLALLRLPASGSGAQRSGQKSDEKKSD
jgi:Spy/CpxP family protein refolding chaperone